MLELEVTLCSVSVADQVCIDYILCILGLLEDISARHEKLIELLAQGKNKEALDFYADDCVIMPPGQEAFQGKEGTVGIVFHRSVHGHENFFSSFFHFNRLTNFGIMALMQFKDITFRLCPCACTVSNENFLFLLNIAFLKFMEASAELQSKVDKTENVEEAVFGEGDLVTSRSKGTVYGKDGSVIFQRK